MGIALVAFTDLVRRYDSDQIWKERMMLTDVQANRARDSLRDSSQSQNILQGAHALFHERKWRQFDGDAETESIATSRWQHSQAPSQHEAIAPPNRYFIGVALIATRVKLPRGGRPFSMASCLPARSMSVVHRNNSARSFRRRATSSTFTSRLPVFRGRQRNGC